MTRAVLAFAGLFYVCAPLAFGIASVAAKARRFPAHYDAGPAGIYNPLLSETSIARVRTALAAYTAPGDVWYLPEPASALDLPGRAILSAADFEPIDTLRAARYTTSRPIRVHALLPRRFEHNGKGAVIRSSFPQAFLWRRADVDASDYVLWTADLSMTP